MDNNNSEQNGYFYSDGPPILDLQNISLSFGDKQILRDITIQVKDLQRPGKKTGQIIGFIGPSGRGKTQLFRIMSGLQRPTTGQVLVHGKPVKLGRIGVVAQNYPLFDRRTVIGNLEAVMRPTAWPSKLSGEQHNIIEYYLEKFKLADHRKKFPCQLSGGQRQRVAIIQQLICSEDIILLDEPFSGLDVNNITEVCATLQDIANQNENNTIVIVSHDISSTTAISTSLWVLGFDYDEVGAPIPGSRIKYVEDLAARGLAWKYPGIFDNQHFNDFVRSMRQVYNTL